MNMFSILNNNLKKRITMSAVGDRISSRMLELGLRHTDLVIGSGASKGTVSNWLNGVNEPTGSRLIDLAKVLNVSPAWLITGAQPPTQFIRVDAWDSNTPLDDDEIEIPFYKDFHLACGSGATGEALDSETRRLRLSKATIKALGIETKNACAMTASGDSMTPIINDKDTIYVDRGRKTIKDGKIFAICHGGLFKVKYLYNLPNGGIRIVSANAAEFPEERLTAQEALDQEFIIEGWVFSYQALMSW